MTKNSGSRQPEFLSTHPSPENRIKKLEQEIVRVKPMQDAARAAGLRPNCKV